MDNRTSVQFNLLNLILLTDGMSIKHNKTAKLNFIFEIMINILFIVYIE